MLSCPKRFSKPVSAAGVVGIQVRRTRLTRHWSRALLVGLLIGASLPGAHGAEPPQSAHALLQKLCDDFGGRLTGSKANEGAMDQLAAQLRALGLEPEKVT